MGVRHKLTAVGAGSKEAVQRGCVWKVTAEAFEEVAVELGMGAVHA